MGKGRGGFIRDSDSCKGWEPLGETSHLILHSSERERPCSVSHSWAEQSQARGSNLLTPSPMLLLLLTVEVLTTWPQADCTQRFLAPPCSITPEAPIAEPASEKATLFDSQDFSILLVKYKMAQTLVIGLEKQKDQPTPSEVPPQIVHAHVLLGGTNQIRGRGTSCSQLLSHKK